MLSRAVALLPGCLCVPVATQASASVSDSLSCGFLLFLLPLKFVFVSQPLPTTKCHQQQVLCCVAAVTQSWQLGNCRDLGSPVKVEH